jgi:hypothetical protein
MAFIDTKLVRVAHAPATPPPAPGRSGRRKRTAAAAFWAFAAVSASAAAPASAATLTRSIDVQGAPDAVWSAIGSFCAIGEWHPAIASCALDGKVPPTRTLATKDNAKFVELQTARSDVKRFYSYTFLSSPLPVTHYTSTLEVTPKAKGVSTITWTGGYTVDPAQAKQANEALAGIYESGLAGIKSRLAR